MELADVLTGLDDRPWATLVHAYGSAEDVPGGLRALAGTDTQAAEQALYEFWGNILHQGTVYPVTAEAVPFLARLAAAGRRSADLLVLLGSIAASSDEHGLAPGACREAVAAQLPVILPLLASDDAGVRQAAAWAVGHTAAGAEAWPALERRWAMEQEGIVRAELLAAMVRVDPARSVAAATAALDSAGPAELRIAGVLACLDAGLPWDATQHDTLLSVLPANDLVAGRFDNEQREPLQAVVDVLLRRDTDQGREAALALLDAALRTPAPEVREEAVWAADHACMISRAAPARLVPLLLPLLDDPSSVPRVLPLLGKIAEQAGPAAAALARLAGSGGDTADRALAALMTIAPDQAAPLLAIDLPQRPRALAVAAGARGVRATDEAALPFTPAVLDAVRRRLADPELSGNEPIHLALLLASWGKAAAAAVPELLDALPRIPLAGPKALRAVCPDEGAIRRRIQRRLAKAVRQGPEDGRLAAAHALYELNGEPHPLLTAIRAELAHGGHRLPQAAQLAARLGKDADDIVPDLRAALSDPAQDRTIPQLDGDVALADALWQITGDADESVRVLDGVLAAADGPWFRWTGIRAARLAARLGPAAQPLRPALERMLATPLHAPAAALALTAIGPEEELREPLDRGTLADLVLDAAESNADPDTAFEALSALGAPALTDEHLRRLAALADRDPRVVDFGLEDEIIRKDERLRARARTTLAALGR
ncbi:hypothetical protein ABT173_39855 [Streptomyces sp. NPDC001795]|uniref:hypothetical protein n=1 Tax=Streptomyces sp. NPDC001795 TaxID=3154525 RepID=UPI003327AA93